MTMERPSMFDLDNGVILPTLRLILYAVTVLCSFTLFVKLFPLRALGKLFGFSALSQTVNALVLGALAVEGITGSRSLDLSGREWALFLNALFMAVSSVSLLAAFLWLESWGPRYYPDRWARYRERLTRKRDKDNGDA